MPLDLSPRPLPLMTADLPGTGGSLKVTPDDFVVEELPAYLPSGEGEHLFLWVEKRELGTHDVAKLLGRASGVGERNVGYAGQKDRFASTRQWFSIATKKDEVRVDDPRVRILEQKRHGNKLRLGHARGNRFTVVLRGVVPDAVGRARAIVDRLGVTGLPNFFGPQRFGRSGDNAALGAGLLGLGGDSELRRAERARHDRHLRRLALSALQSEIFNRVLAERIADGLWERVIDVDVLQKRGGGYFTTDDAALDSERVARGEVDITGPLPGPRERPESRGEARAREDRVLAGCGILREAFVAGGGEAEGARRTMRVPLVDVQLRLHDPGTDVQLRLHDPDVQLRLHDPGTGTLGTLELSFPLPSGSYATRVLAEVMKGEVDVPEV